ncbi:MAG: sigma-70 family RNA polymerase sigma factor [Pseudomonadota bacterium]
MSDYIYDMALSEQKSHVMAALRAHGSELRRFVRARVDACDVDDVLQMAALRAIEKAQTLRDPASARSWLYTVHSHVITDVQRAGARERRLLEAAAAEPIEGEATAETPALCDCSVAQAKRLAPNYASILKLVDMGGVSLADAAGQLNISLNNATVRLHRARAVLKKRLLEHCGVTTMRACLDCGCTESGCCSA